MGIWQGPTDCTGPVGNLGSAGNLLERLDTVKVIRCDEVQWRFLGLSLAGYNFLISLLMAAIAAWGIARSARTDTALTPARAMPGTSNVNRCISVRHDSGTRRARPSASPDSRKRRKRAPPAAPRS